MATIFVLPNILPSEYELFRRDIGPNFADTFDQWRKVMTDQIEKDRRVGDTVVEIDLKHDEFIAHRDALGEAHDGHALYRFIAKIRHERQ